MLNGSSGNAAISIWYKRSGLLLGRRRLVVGPRFHFGQNPVDPGRVVQHAGAHLGRRLLVLELVGLSLQILGSLAQQFQVFPKGLHRRSDLLRFFCRRQLPAGLVALGHSFISQTLAATQGRLRRFRRSRKILLDDLEQGTRLGQLAGFLQANALVQHDQRIPRRARRGP